MRPRINLSEIMVQGSKVIICFRTTSEKEPLKKLKHTNTMNAKVYPLNLIYSDESNT